jgi:ATP-dependent DNA helicase RecG
VVGAKTAKLLAKAFEMHTSATCCHHFPRRYAERGELTDIASLSLGEEVTILAQVIRARRSGARPGDRSRRRSVDGPARSCR